MQHVATLTRPVPSLDWTSPLGNNAEQSRLMREVRRLAAILEASPSDRPTRRRLLAIHHHFSRLEGIKPTDE